MADINARTRLLVGTTADWAAADLVLGDGEVVLERAGGLIKMKAGDGAAHYSALPFLVMQPTIPPEYVTQDEGDARYLQLAGISTTPAANLVPRMGATGLLDAGMIPLPPAIAVTAGAADAGKLIKTAPTGKLDLTFLPPIIAASGGVADADKLVKTSATGKVDLTFLPPIIAVSAGAADAGKLIKTAASGKIDPSLITITVGKYRGTADGTATKPAGTYIAGDYFINSGSGLADASWGLPVDTVVVPNQQIYFNGTTWDLVGSGDTSVMLLPDGTAAMPGLGFLADQSTGIWRPNPRSLGFSVGGIEKVRANAPTATDAELLVGLSASVQSPPAVAGHGLLEIAGSNHARINLDVAGTATALFYADASLVVAGSTVAKPFLFWTSSVEKGRFTESADAQLLVGTTAAHFSTAGRGLVEVNGSNYSSYGLSIAGVGKGYFGAFAGSISIVSNQAIPISFATNGVQKASITESADAQLLVGSSGAQAGTTGRGLVEINGSTSSLLGFDIGNALKGYMLVDGVNTIISNQPIGGFVAIQIAGANRLTVSNTAIIDAINGQELGWRNLPVSTTNFAGSYVFTLADRGKCIALTGSSTGATIGDFGNGAVHTVWNGTAGPVAITASGVQLVWNGILVTTSRTLAKWGIATLVNLGGTTIIMTGQGIS